MKSNVPYLSVVIAARNDNYGGDFASRLRIFADSLARQNERHPNLFELVVAEWNPPPENPSLAELLDWSLIGQVRIVTVSNALHMSVPARMRPPLFEYRAKNVALRRARGAFVIVTNADIAFSDELFDFIARRDLREDAFYRVDRHDYLPDEAEPWPGRILRINRRHDPTGIVAISPTGDFGPDRNVWPESQSFGDDIFHDSGRVIECRAELGPLWGLHTNASGDFVLASRRAFHAAGGYWERTDTVPGIDGGFLIQLQRKGFRQFLLLRPYTIFHHEHDRDGHNFIPKLPRPEISVFHKGIHDGAETGPFEQPSWGMAGVDLPEICFRSD